jgi:hypothetical protein
LLSLPCGSLELERQCMCLNYSSMHKTFVTVSESSKITQVQVTIAINCSTLPYYINMASDRHGK